MELPMDALSPMATPAEETLGPTFRPVPEETATLMPVQDLERWEAGGRVGDDHDRSAARRRRTMVFTATLALTAVASFEMYQVLTTHHMTGLQVALLVVFTVNF